MLIISLVAKIRIIFEYKKKLAGIFLFYCQCCAFKMHLLDDGALQMRHNMGTWDYLFITLNRLLSLSGLRRMSQI